MTGSGRETVDGAHQLEMFRMMVLIREFEEQVRSAYLGGMVPGMTHLCSGQEATAVGVCAALDRDDYIASHHRGHGHCLAKGAAPDRLMAEILGRADGYCGGRSGTLHIYDAANANLGTNGIVGGGVPLATGAGLSAKVRGTGQVAVAYFGDGALNQGIVQECMNMASLWKLPVVYVCENNGYGEFTAMETVTAGANLPARGEVLDIPSKMIDGMDVLAVHANAVEAIARARAGEGPSFLICNTYRYGGHHVTDRQDYKSAEEVAEWQKKDPIARLRKHLLEHGVADDQAIDALHAQVAEVVREAYAYALASPEPDPATLRAHLYA